MGATRLVFGSPKNRDRGTLNETQTMEIAVPFFRMLGERASELGVQFCLEPNPVGYACNFMTTTEGGAKVVRAVGNPGIRLHLDAGAMAMNGEDPAAEVARHHELVGYVHASEPNLATVGQGRVHHALAQALDRYLPTMPVSIEMRGAGLAVLPTVIAAVRSAYQQSRPCPG
jgi:sugar phosphate isomerase/epimerase